MAAAPGTRISVSDFASLPEHVVLKLKTKVALADKGVIRNLTLLATIKKEEITAKIIPVPDPTLGFVPPIVWPYVAQQLAAMGTVECNTPMFVDDSGAFELTVYNILDATGAKEKRVQDLVNDAIATNSITHNIDGSPAHSSAAEEPFRGRQLNYPFFVSQTALREGKVMPIVLRSFDNTSQRFKTDCLIKNFRLPIRTRRPRFSPKGQMFIGLDGSMVITYPQAPDRFKGLKTAAKNVEFKAFDCEYMRSRSIIGTDIDPSGWATLCDKTSRSIRSTRGAFARKP